MNKSLKGYILAVSVEKWVKGDKAALVIRKGNVTRIIKAKQ